MEKAKLRIVFGYLHRLILDKKTYFNNWSYQNQTRRADVGGVVSGKGVQ
jgi:hypothetical protein